MLPPLYVSIPLFLCGLVLGSFGNVLISRFPAGRSLMGHSRCPHCKKILSWEELIPLLSYLLQGGKCRKCRKPISPRYPLVELLTGCLVVLSFTLYEPFLQTVTLSIALWLLLLIAIFDAESQRIPDLFNGLFFVFASAFVLLTGTFDPSGLLLGVGFFGSFWLLSHGRSMGSGYIILGAGIGMLLGGWRTMLASLFFAYVIGACVAITLLLLKKKTRKDRLAFAPFLAIGTLLALLFQEQVQTLVFP